MLWPLIAALGFGLVLWGTELICYCAACEREGRQE